MPKIREQQLRCHWRRGRVNNSETVAAVPTIRKQKLRGSRVEKREAAAPLEAGTRPTLRKQQLSRGREKLSIS